jgi:hypothetical protein
MSWLSRRIVSTCTIWPTGLPCRTTAPEYIYVRAVSLIWDTNTNSNSMSWLPTGEGREERGEGRGDREELRKERGEGEEQVLLDIYMRGHHSQIAASVHARVGVMSCCITSPC